MPASGCWSRPIPIGALIGGSVASAAIGGGASLIASGQQISQDKAALATQVAAQNEATQALAGYNQIGTGADQQLANLFGIAYGATGSGTGSTSPTGIVTPVNVNAANSSPGGQAVENAALANFTNTPNYQFALQQGNRALAASLAANGQYFSGAQLQAAQSFGQGLASQQFQNYYNNLLSLAQLGAGTGQSLASNAINAGNAQAATQQGIGTAQASGTIGAASALGGGVSSLGGNILLSNALNQNSLSAYNATTAASVATTPEYSNPGLSSYYDLSGA